MEYNGGECVVICLTLQLIRKKKIHVFSCVLEMDQEGEQMLDIEASRRNVWVCYESQQSNCMECMGGSRNNNTTFS